MKTISLRITDTESDALDELARWHYRSNRTAAIAQALSLLFEQHKLKANAKSEIAAQRRRHRHRNMT